ncbi:AAA family ATPase [Streptomyces sp. NPDC049555]|uniref:AAA family ATPase n=1 Tax=Streptomyces sp. NPDC049555 TaxID=3154930 RepID=UPI003413DE6C
MERALLGAVIFRPDQFLEASTVLRPEDFYTPAHEHVWRAISRQAEAGLPFELPALSAALSESGVLGAQVNTTVFVSQLCDAAGTDASYYAERVALAAQRRRRRQAVMRLQQAMDDTGLGEAGFAEVLEENLPQLRGERVPDFVVPGGRTLRLTPASAIEPQPVVWAWEDEGAGRVPAGALTLAAGREGTGKSSFGIWMAAQVTRGTLPGAFHGTPRNVVYVAVEDSWSQTLVPRLMAAGADLDRVFRVDAVLTETGEETTLSLPSDNTLFEKALVENDVALVVLDPLMSTMGQGIDTHKERETRRALDPLARMADRTGAVMLGIAHFSKGSGTDAASLITGSGAFKNVARAILGFARDDQDDSRVMTQAKNSLGRADLPSRDYGIEDTLIDTPHGTAHVGRFVLGDTSERSVADILAAPLDTEEAGERTEATQWLLSFLADNGGEAARADVMKAAKALSYSESTIKRARSKARVKATQRKGFGGGTVWLHPDNTQSGHSQSSGSTPSNPGPTDPTVTSLA